MAESRLITDPFEGDWLHLWEMIRVSCEIERHKSARPGDPTLAETMVNEIRRVDQEGGPAYRARVVAAALAYGENEIREIEEALADARAAVELLRQPSATFMRATLKVAKPDA